MDNATCQNCKYYFQHYSLNERKIYRLFCGHCYKHPRKNRKPTAAVCDFYEPGQPAEDRFATKEYLSKALLQRVLELELLPEIYEGSER